MLTGVLGRENGKRIFLDAEWIDHDHIFVHGRGYKVYRENRGGCLAIHGGDNIQYLLQSKGEEEWDDRPEENLPKEEYLQEVKRLKGQYDDLTKA